MSSLGERSGIWMTVVVLCLLGLPHSSHAGLIHGSQAHSSLLVNKGVALLAAAVRTEGSARPPMDLLRALSTQDALWADSGVRELVAALQAGAVSVKDLDADLRPVMRLLAVLPEPELPHLFLMGPEARSSVASCSEGPEILAGLTDRMKTSLNLAQATITQRAFVAYLLNQPASALGDELSTETLLAAGGPIELAILESALLGQAQLDPKGQPLVLDTSNLRRALNLYYSQSRGFPATLEELRAEVVDYHSLRGVVIDSVSKKGPRRMFRDRGLGVSVGETLVDGAVVETEVLFGGRRDDGALDFAAYDANGHLSPTFTGATPSGNKVLEAPMACMACHARADRAAGLIEYNVRFPRMGRFRRSAEK